MEEYILSIGHSENNKFAESTTKLKQIWQAHKAAHETLEQNVNAFVHVLSEVLIGVEKIQPAVDVGDRQNIRRKRKGEGKRRRRQAVRATANQRRRYRYARCQEMYKQCPKRLAEIALSGDFTFTVMRKEPPAVEAIEELYGQLWGQEGPQEVDFMLEGGKDAKRLINEIFPPIKLVEVKARISRVKARSAAELDGVKKGHC